MQHFHSYDVADGHGLPHDPLKAIVAPRPIGWISSADADGRANLAPYSFFNMVSTHPPLIGFSSEGEKDSFSNIRATGVFCFNLATLPLARRMNRSSAGFPADVDEFAEAGLDRLACDAIPVPRVAASPAALECRLTEIHELRDIEGAPVGAHLVLGQVVRVHIATHVLREGLFDITGARTIARCGYASDYALVRDMFEMARPG